MNPLKRLIAAFACVAFLLSGGLGMGAQLLICMKTDGQVRVETSLNRCCDDPESQNDLPTSTEPPVALFDASESCSDQWVGRDQEPITPRRTLKHAAEQDVHPPVPAVLLTLVPTDPPAFLACTRQAPGAPAHAPIQVVVLRC